MFCVEVCSVSLCRRIGSVFPEVAVFKLDFKESMKTGESVLLCPEGRRQGDVLWIFW